MEQNLTTELPNHGKNLPEPEGRLLLLHAAVKRLTDDLESIRTVLPGYSIEHFLEYRNLTAHSNVLQLQSLLIEYEKDDQQKLLQDLLSKYRLIAPQLLTFRPPKI